MYGTDITSHAQYVNATQQGIEPICGIMAVALAFTCLIGEDPACTQYDITSARQHLRTCILQGQIHKFPNLQRNISCLTSSPQKTTLSMLDNYFEDQLRRNKIKKATDQSCVKRKCI